MVPNSQTQVNGDTTSRTQDDDLKVTISASAKANVIYNDENTSSNNPTNTRLVHAISVTQPVQSWTVIRDHNDLLHVYHVLSTIVTGGLPPCPPPPTFQPSSPNNNSGNPNNSPQQTSSPNTSPTLTGTSHTNTMIPQDMAQIIQTRNLAQQWLTQVLSFPGARESPAIRQFLCYGANMVPPQFEGISWVSFSSSHNEDNSSSRSANNNNSSSSSNSRGTGTTMDSSALLNEQNDVSQLRASNNTSASNNNSSLNNSVDELEMEFGLEDSGAEDDEDDDSNIQDASGPNDQFDDDTDYFSAVERYQPTVEEITQDDVIEFQNNADDVEMIEDVGSFAQSLGASHLGRSLQLQAEMANRMQQQQQQQQQYQHSQQLPLSQAGGMQHHLTHSSGLNFDSVGTGGMNANSNTVFSSGGIGNAVETTATQKIDGLGDSFFQKSPTSAPRLDSFRMIKVIGKGSFGKVFLVREIDTNEMFALKVLKKDNIIKRNQVEHTRTERSVLGYVNHPFIVGLKMAFQSTNKLYFVLDYCAGGELFFHLSKVGKFQEPRAAFYAAEIVLALAYIHELDIVYRDLKPENVLLDARGHVRLTDFGLSKEGISSSSSGATSFCGTPEYLAPEILNRQGHGRAVDWWSLGALLYEMLTGLPPFYCRDREMLFEKIRKGHLEYPRSLSARAQALLRGLLTKDPRRRLGSGEDDAEAIKGHAFFSEMDWIRLAKGGTPPPWDPQIHGSLDTSQFDEEFTNMPIFSPQSHQNQYGFGARTQDNNVFEGFTFTDHRFYGPKGEAS